MNQDMITLASIPYGTTDWLNCQKLQRTKSGLWEFTNFSDAVVKIQVLRKKIVADILAKEFPPPNGGLCLKKAIKIFTIYVFVKAHKLCWQIIRNKCSKIVNIQKPIQINSKW